MATKEQRLEDLTFKHDSESVSQRVFLTLTDGNNKSREHRTALLLSHLVERLVGNDQISEQQLDEMLLEVVG
jgi:hypothetical protein